MCGSYFYYNWIFEILYGKLKAQDLFLWCQDSDNDFADELGDDQDTWMNLCILVSTVEGKYDLILGIYVFHKNG